MSYLKVFLHSIYSFASIIVFLSALLLSPNVSLSQQLPENGIYQEYLQALRINGDISQTAPLSKASLDSADNHPWKNLTQPNANLSSGNFFIAPHDPIFRTYWQSLEPGGAQDGPVWQGRGFTTDLSAGFFVRYGILSASVSPHIMFNQNRAFTLSPYPTTSDRSKYAYPLGNIDWPQRFGDESFWSFDPGNSYIRADYYGWTTGISNAQMRWGPGRENAILLDTNAPGFQHFFIGTSEPKDIYVGKLQTKLFWGKLFESNFFDQNSLNNERYISGITVSVTPKYVPGLKVGINRIFYETIPPEGIPVGDLFKIFEAFTKINFTSSGNAGGNDQADQLISLFGQWTFPKSGLEVYAEWARTDHSWNWRDFITEPAHSRGYTLGLQKTFDLPRKRLLSINAEFTQLEASRTGVFRGYPTFYVHSRAQQGYSNEGQLLGASIGPGSSSQYLGGSLFFNKGRIKLFAQRVAQNNDFLYESDAMLEEQIQDPGIQKYWLHNVEFRFGTSFHYFYNQFESSIGITYRHELNDDYVYKNDKNHLGISFSLRYRLSDLR